MVDDELRILDLKQDEVHGAIQVATSACALYRKDASEKY